MQCALSIASGVPLFEHFKVNKKKVLLVQFENENADMQKRFGRFIKDTPTYETKERDIKWYVYYDEPTIRAFKSEE